MIIILLLFVLLIHSFIRSFVRSFVRSFIHSFIYLFIFSPYFTAGCSDRHVVCPGLPNSFCSAHFDWSEQNCRRSCGFCSGKLVHSRILYHGRRRHVVIVFFITLHGILKSDIFNKKERKSGRRTLLYSCKVFASLVKLKLKFALRVGIIIIIIIIIIIYSYYIMDIN